jgi:hypothetical protein
MVEMKLIMEIIAFTLTTYFGSAVIYVGARTRDWVLVLLGAGFVVCGIWRLIANGKEA